MKFRAGLFTVLVLVFLIAAAVYTYHAVSTFDACDTRIDRQVASPDRKWVAVIFHRDCGATVDFNTQVSLVPAGKVFSFSEYPSAYSSSGNAVPTVFWQAPSRLQITPPRGEKIYRRNRAVGTIAITYR